MFQAVFKGPVSCPLEKPILQVLDYHVCYYMKAMVYAGQVNYKVLLLLWWIINAARQHCTAS